MKKIIRNEELNLIFRSFFIFTKFELLFNRRQGS